MRLWRISNYADLSGQGGLYSDGRWHSQGDLVVYLAEHPALALTEIMVHFDLPLDLLPEHFQLLEVESDGPVADCPPLPEGWESDQEITQGVGDTWLARGDTLMLKVPSIVVPRSFNYLYNPRHPAAEQAQIINVSRHLFDQRLFPVQ